MDGENSPLALNFEDGTGIVDYSAKRVGDFRCLANGCEQTFPRYFHWEKHTKTHSPAEFASQESPILDNRTPASSAVSRDAAQVPEEKPKRYKCVFCPNAVYKFAGMYA